jgi:hypothetical protein
MEHFGLDFAALSAKNGLKTPEKWPKKASSSY